MSDFLKDNLGDWYKPLIKKIDFNVISYELGKEISKSIVYPEINNIFRIFKLLSPKDIKVVILGQDPYHNGQATGIAFGTDSYPLPPSLIIILSELTNSVYKDESVKYDETLLHWVNQGVFLLNTSLTVRKGSPGSHVHIWKEFTKAVFEVLSEYTGLIYLLWGNNAKSYEKYINPNINHILKAAHPAAETYSKRAGFYYCNHFVKVNEILTLNNGQDHTIQWKL